MAYYRSIFCKMLDDVDYQQLSKDERLLLLTMRLCEDAGVASAFRYYPGKLCQQSGLTEGEFKAAMDALALKGWVMFDSAVVWVINGLRHDPNISVTNANHRAAIKAQLEGLPKCEILASFRNYYSLESPSKGIGRASEGLCEAALAKQEQSKAEHEQSKAEKAKEKGDVAHGATPSPSRTEIQQAKYKPLAIEVLNFLNEKTGRNYRAVDTNLDFIVARLRSGVTVQDCKTVIVRKARKWKNDEKMDEYLRPATLFNKTKFEQYLGECVPGTGKKGGE